MHGVYLFKAGCCCCCCLPVLIWCARARSCSFVRSPSKGCPVCDVIPTRKQRKVWHFFAPFVSPICDHGWRRGSRRHELRRGALRPPAVPPGQTGFVRCGSGICPPDGKWWQRTGVCRRPASVPRWLGALGNTHARARDQGHVRRGGCGRYASNPHPHLRAACCPAPLPITAG